MTVIGLLVIIFSLVMLGIITFTNVRKEDKVVEGRYGNKTLPASPKFIANWSLKRSLVLLIVGGLFVLVGLSTFYAKQGVQYFILSPNGKKSAVTTEGFKFVTPFSKVQEWQKYIDIKVISDSIPEIELEEIEGKMSPIDIRFIDQVTAKAYVSVRFELPQDEKSFIDIALKFRSQSNLVNNTLLPTIKEQMLNTAYMFAAQNYISGDAQSFRQTFEEQLRDGAYAVNKIEVLDTIYTNIQSDVDRTIKEIKTSYLVKKVYKDGKPKRIQHEITDNNILVSQVIVGDIVLEDAFKKRLEAQRDESAKRQLEQQKIETAKSTQQRIIAEGERDKSAERVEQEKEQVKALISIETKLKQESTNKELALIALETEKLKAQAEKVKADAESYKNAKLVQAGLTPQERAEWEYKRAVGVAEALAGPNGITLPSTYVNSGGGNGGNKDDMMMMLLLQMMQQNTKK